VIAKFVKGGQSSGGLKLPQSQPNIIVGPACMMSAEINATGRAYIAYNQVIGPVLPRWFRTTGTPTASV